MFGKKKEPAPEQPNYHTRRAQAEHQGHPGVIQNLFNTPPLVGRCCRCGNIIVGSMAFDEDTGEPMCLKHM